MSGPDYVIAGAPRAGTTSLARWLARQPSVHMATPKEPFFYADTDFGQLRRRYGVADADAYDRLFESGRRAGKCCGEASTLYLADREALTKLVHAHPDVRVVVLVRDPARIAVSFYQQMRLMGFEPRSFGEAWAAISRWPADVPASFPDALLADYVHVASLATQLRRASTVVDRSRLLTVLFDDLVDDPGGTLERVGAFLGVAVTGAADLPHENTAREPRSGLAGVLRSSRVRRPLQRVAARVPESALSPVRTLRDRLLFQPTTVEVSDDEMQAVRRAMAPVVRDLGVEMELDLTERWGYAS